MIDLVTVVFRDELRILQAQAQSIEKFCEDLHIGNIYVVINDHDNIARLVDSGWWGKFSDRVVAVPRSVFSTAWGNNGWVSQQALKLMTAAISYNRYSMILDAKTIFVRKLSLDQLINAQGQIQTGQLAVYPVFEPSRQIVNQLFGIDLAQQAGPGGVPFVVGNDAVRDLIAEVFARTARPFPIWFQEQGRVTEFLLYSGYVVKGAGSLDVMYSRQNHIGRVINVCHTEVDAWDRKFAEMNETDTLTVSVHRNAWNALSQQQRQQYQQFLIDRGVNTAWQI